MEEMLIFLWKNMKCSLVKRLVFFNFFFFKFSHTNFGKY